MAELGMEQMHVVLHKEEVTKRLGVCERTLEKLVKSGKFPPGLKLGKHVMWAEQAVEKWLAGAFQAQLDWQPVQRSPRQRKA